MSIIPNLDEMTDADKLKVLESIQQSIRESKEIQKKKIGENVQMVVSALKKIENDISNRFERVAATIENRVANIKDGEDGVAGADGRPGRDGQDGRPGKDGKNGRDGMPGADGAAGQDGVSVINAFLDFDNSLVIELSNGQSINAGEVLPPDIADKLKIIVNTGTGGVGLPEQTGNAGKYLTTDGVNTSWASVGGGGGGGDVVGPASATDNAVARFDATTGKLIQNSAVTISDTGAMSGVASLGVANYIDFDTTPTVTSAVGRLFWDEAQFSLAVGLTANVSSDIGQSLYARVTNAEATTITKGQVVYAFGATGNRMSVKLAINTGDASSAKTIGVAAEDITAGATGMIICQGQLSGLNLGTYTDGDSIYLGSTAGSITATKPYAPNHLVYVGTVERANAGNGILYVRIQNGYELDELHNVSAQNPTNGQTLIYNETTSLWEKHTLTAGTNISITNAAGSITIAATGGAAGDVVGPSSSVDSELVLFNSTTGKLLKSATLTGIVKATSGVASAATAGTDYAAPTSGTSILYGNGAGGFSNVTIGSGLSFTTGTLSATGGGGSTSIGLVRAIAINCILC